MTEPTEFLIENASLVLPDRVVENGWVAVADGRIAEIGEGAAPERGILDSGSKTLTSDIGGLDGHGLILEYPSAKIAKFAEEHGFLDLSASNERPKVGEVVRIVPNHVCVVVNMVDRLVTVRGDKLVGELPVAARGKLT